MEMVEGQAKPRDAWKSMGWMLLDEGYHQPSELGGQMQGRKSLPLFLSSQDPATFLQATPHKSLGMGVSLRLSHRKVKPEDSGDTFSPLQSKQHESCLPCSPQNCGSLWSSWAILFLAHVFPSFFSCCLMASCSSSLHLWLPFPPQMYFFYLLQSLTLQKNPYCQTTSSKSCRDTCSHWEFQQYLPSKWGPMSLKRPKHHYVHFTFLFNSGALPKSRGASGWAATQQWQDEPGECQSCKSMLCRLDTADPSLNIRIWLGTWVLNVPGELAMHFSPWFSD